MHAPSLQRAASTCHAGTHLLIRAQVFGLFSLAAMVFGPGHIFYGVGRALVELAVQAIPFVAEPGFRRDFHQQRDLDFVELFSGRGFLSSELRNETWLGCQSL